MIKLNKRVLILVASITMVVGFTFTTSNNVNASSKKARYISSSQSVYVKKDGFHYCFNRAQADGNGRVYKMPLHQAEQRGFTMIGTGMPHRHINRFFR